MLADAADHMQGHSNGNQLSTRSAYGHGRSRYRIASDQRGGS